MTATDARIFELGDYRIDVIVHGFPGKSVCHGPLGFSTIALVRYKNKVALIDVGGFGQRLILLDRLKELGVTPEGVTDILLTHSHFDHAINWVA
ncbi:MAG: MBL fold metallo-hydrolase, partial [Burkholderiales bacterium]